ncbi:hypothetical protein ACUH78_02270 [Thauera sp. ZXT1-4]|uniref:hypothetical protein n=1 Tax=Thauera sp. ZXT1-4 TaxID=3460294 RepID=UPI0040408C20
MLNKDRFVETFGATLGVALFAFGILSFPLAVYAINGFTQMGVFVSVLALIGLYMFIPFGELVGLVLAVLGLIDLLFY